MKETIAQKILSDARADAEATIAQAQQKAQSIVAQAQGLADSAMAEVRREVESKCADVKERKAALARLDGAKIALWGKHRVIDAIYDMAQNTLLSLPKKEAVDFVCGLIESYAEEGDVVVLDENFAYDKEVAAHPVFAQKKLTLSKKKGSFGGGVILKGEKSDKDLSVPALLLNDKNENAAQLAAQLFA